MAHLRLDRRNTTEYRRSDRNEDVIELIPPERSVRESALHALVEAGFFHLGFPRGDGEVVE